MIEVPKDRISSLAKYTFIDLFAGIGGFRMALESFGAKCVFSSEWDKFAQEAYFSNFHEQPHGDITQINECDIPKHDFLCGGFPCQAFSISGKQKGFEDSRGTLFFDVARIVRYHQPKLVFLENVANFAKHDNGRTLSVVLRTLDELGYNVTYKVLNAGNYGVPQKRERIYILGFRKDIESSSFSFPGGNGINVSLKDILMPNEEVPNFFITKYTPTWLRDINVEADLFNMLPNKPIRIGTVNKGGQGERIYHTSGHAITLSAYGGGVGAKTGLYMVDGVLRKLAPRECARLMGLPDTFKIHPNKNQAYKQFGNGVVVNVLQHILFSIIERGIL